MANPFLGEIKMGGWNFAPLGFTFCNGQLLSIASESALFALLGTTYGGDGVVTFAVPDLRGRSAWGMGTGAGLSTYNQGEVLGQEAVTLTTNQLPAHNHVAVGVAGPSVPGAGTAPTNQLWNGQTNVADPPYAAGLPTATMAGTAIANQGSGQPHNNRQPYLGINFVIALVGIFPSRN